jgi:hypothetical protein
VDHAHDEIRLHTDDAVGEMLAVRVGGDEEAWAAHQIVEGVETVVQGQGHFIALLTDHGQRSTVRRAVRPDPDAGFLAGDLADFLRDVAHVGANPCLEIGLGFIALGHWIVSAGRGGRLHVALRVGQNPFVVGIGVRGNFHQSRLRDFTHLIQVRKSERTRGAPAKSTG